MLHSNQQSTTRSRRAVAVRYLLATTLVAASVSLAGVGSAVVPRKPYQYGPQIERLASYDPQTRCTSFVRRGTKAFANMLLRTYPSTRNLGMLRACNVGGTSEHKSGRAFDWGASVYNSTDRTAVESLLHWLLKKDKYGHRYAMARRLGIMYIIWNRRIWGAYSASSGWRSYSGSNPHTDHVHFSLSFRGARKRTSFWQPPPAAAQAAPAETAPTGPPPAPQPQASLPRPRPVASLAEGPALVDETVSLRAGSRFGTRTLGALEAGRRYLVEASGMYTHSARASSRADAECSTTDAGWRRHGSVREDAPTADHLDLYVDGRDLKLASDSGGECARGSHVYRRVYVPRRDGRVPLRIWDPTSHADNSGRLRVRIIDLAPRTTMSWRVPARAPAGVMSPGSLQGGLTYLVTLTGTWQDGSGTVVDAECSRAAAGGGPWRRELSGATSGAASDDLGVLVDGSDVEADPARELATGPECDPSAHAYRFLVRDARHGPMNVRVGDLRTSDNAGALRVSLAPYEVPSGREQVTLDASAIGATVTDRVYAEGTPLRLRVSGTYRLRRGVRADGECARVAPGLSWRRSHPELENSNGVDLGDVTVGGRRQRWRTFASGACDSERHRYVLDLTTQRSAPLSLGVADRSPGDNQGALTVTVEPR